jgi:uncharacterized protein
MINSLSTLLLQLLVLTPFTILATRMNNGKTKPNLLFAAVLVFVITSVATDLLSPITFFEGQNWNWAGKAASLLIGLVFIFIFKPFKLQQYGLTTKMELADTKPILLICAAYLLLRLTLFIAATKQPITFNTETILFQATLPGLAEEIIYRGILLALLNSIFIQPKWNFAKISFGWAAVLTSILFGLTHSILFDSNYSIHFNYFAFFRSAFDGFLFALLTEKTKSLVPAILFHNLLNLVGNH